MIVARPVAASWQQDQCAEPEELYLTAQFFRVRDPDRPADAAAAAGAAAIVTTFASYMCRGAT